MLDSHIYILCARKQYLWQLIAIVFVCHWPGMHLPFAHALDDNADTVIAKRLIERIYKDRTAIDFLEIEWDVEIASHESQAALNGCKYSLHGWFDFERHWMRVDSEDHCPNDERLSRKRRFAFSGTRFLVVDGEDLVGREREGLTASFIRDHASGTVFSLSGDMRLMGTLPERYTTLKNFPMEEILRPLSDSKSVSVEEEEIDGRQVYKVRFSGYYGADCELTYWIDKQFGMPTRILCETSTDSGAMRTEITTDWQPYTSGDNVRREVLLPTRSVSRRWEDGRLANEEKLTIRSAEIGIRPQGDVFTWARMDLPDKFVVRHTAGKSRQMKQWNAATATFGPWESQPLVTSEELIPDASTGQRTWLLVCNIIVIAVVLAFLVKRRMLSRAN